MKKVIFCTLLFFVFMLASCKNISNAGKTREPTNSKFAVINFDNLNVRAAASETYEPLKVEDEDIVRIEFIAKGIKDDGSIYTPDIFTSSTDSGTSGQIAWSGESCMENFKADSFLLFPGNYNFYLNIYTYDLNGYERLTLSAKLLNQTLEAGKTKTLTFTASYSDEGDLSITYQWPAKDRVGSVKMGLYPLDDLDNPVYGYAMTEIPLEEIEIDGESYFSALYKATELTNGVYWLKIKLYDTDPEFPDVIGNYLDVVSIYGYKTTGTKTLESSDYNQNYLIKYQLGEGQEIYSYGAPDRHNQCEAVILKPSAIENTNAYYVFGGWYTDESLSEEFKVPSTTLLDSEGNPYEVQIIALGTDLHTKDLTLYPKWDIIVAYDINIRGKKSSYDIQLREEIVVEDKDGTHVFDSSDENGWYNYFYDIKNTNYSLGDESPFTGITSVSRRGYALSWDVKYTTLSGESGDVNLAELPKDDCGTLTFKDNGETQTVSNIVSYDIYAKWQAYPVEITYSFPVDGVYQPLVPDMLSYKIGADDLEEYIPYREYNYIEAAELLGSGYTWNRTKSTYVLPSGSETKLKISNIFEPANYDLAFNAKKSIGGETDDSLLFSFYFTNIATGDGFFNIKKEISDDPNYKDDDGNFKTYNAYVCLGIGRYVDGMLYLLNKYEYVNRDGDKYEYEVQDLGLYTIDNFDDAISEGDAYSIEISPSGTFQFESGAIGSGNAVTYKITKQNSPLTSEFVDPDYNNDSLIIEVEDNLAAYTVSSPADLNKKTSFCFTVKHSDDEEMLYSENLDIYISLLQNNKLIQSWDEENRTHTYLYLNSDDENDEYYNKPKPADEEQGIFIKSLPNAGTYQLYINVIQKRGEGMIYTGSYSTSFVVNNTLNYSIDDDTDENTFKQAVKDDLKNAKGIVNVVISGKNSTWGSSVPSYISEALSDGFVALNENEFFVNLDLSGLEGIEEFSGLENKKDDTEYTNGKLLTLKLPSSITKIASGAVNGFGKLYSIQLPASVTTIKSNAFVGSGRKFILEDPDEESSFMLGSNDTVILNKAGTNLYDYASGTGKLIIPDGVTNLPYGIDTENVVSLYVPDSLKDIQSLKTDNLQELSINASKTSVSANGTLEDTLPNLQKLTLRGNYTDTNDFEAPTFPDVETPIEKYPVGNNVAKLLAYCVDTLTDLTFDGDVVIPETPFTNPSGWEDYNGYCVNFFTRFNPKDSDGYEVSSTKLKSLTFNGAATIGKQAFYHCRGLQYYIEGNTKKTLNLTVFDSSGVSIEFNGDSPKTIGENAFGQLNSTDVAFDHIKLQGVTSIGKEAFQPLNFGGSDPYVEFSDSLIKLGPRAFGWNFSDVSKLKGIDYSVWYTTNDPAVWSSYEGLAETVLRKQTTFYKRKTYESLSDLLTELNVLSYDEESNAIYNYLVRPVKN